MVGPYFSQSERIGSIEQEEHNMKVSLSNPTNAYCPQTFYTYGTYKEDGTPNFGLFCWFGFCWDGELSIMACIGGEKLTKDRIRATGRFSANLVTEELLPLANYFGNKSGYDPNKMQVDAVISKGRVLDIPILQKVHGSLNWRSSRRSRLMTVKFTSVKSGIHWWKNSSQKKPGKAKGRCPSTKSSRWSDGAEAPFSR